LLAELQVAIKLIRNILLQCRMTLWNVAEFGIVQNIEPQLLQTVMIFYMAAFLMA